MNKLILASASPRRVELLRTLEVDFDVIPSTAEELHTDSIEPRALCELNAERKALEVASRVPGQIILAADTLVFLGRELFGKPRDLSHAREMLSQLSGKAHDVITGVCILHKLGKRVFSEITRVSFRPLSSDAIESYIATVPVLDKAGAYGIQERGEILVEKVDGSYSNVVGLPVERLAGELDALAIPHKARSR